MAYIYKITNSLNGKIYIGKTDYSLEKRWKEHCRDSKKVEIQNRPLYKAMCKYGIENFYIELIEETTQPDLREQFWIEYLGSFKNGYNATLGGDGAHYADYDLIFSLWEQGKAVAEIVELTNYCTETVSRALKCFNINSTEKRSRGKNIEKKPVCKIDKHTGNILKIYESISEAERNEQTNKHIQDVCKGKRKTAGGFIWKYLADIDVPVSFNG